MDKRIFWIWLQQAFGEGSPMPWRIYEKFPGGPEEFYFGQGPLWDTMGSITDKEAASLQTVTIGEAEARLEYAQKVGWEVITPETPQYPQQLKHIANPPAVLYGKGEMPDLDAEPMIAVAGARKATENSINAAGTFGYQLAIGGATIISGGAMGVDAQALTGAMSAMGSVISILPVDLGSPYVVKNAGLRRDIAQNGGMLLTEYFSQRNPAQGTFQLRNRLITGMAHGVLVIQAAKQSGTMMYGRLAAEHDRDLFVYPGPPGSEDDPAFEGSRILISEGAKPVTSGNEILCEYEIKFPDRKREEKPVFKVIAGNLSGDDRDEDRPVLNLADSSREPVKREAPDFKPQTDEEFVLDALGREPMTVGQISERTGLPTARVLALLTELELEGLAVSVAGKRYARAVKR